MVTIKIMQVMKWVQDKIRSPSVHQGAMHYILWYALLLVFCCTIYLTGWCVDWYVSGKPNLPELRNFLHEIASTPWIAVIGFIGKAFIDKDNDGIPDEFEETKGNDEK